MAEPRQRPPVKPESCNLAPSPSGLGEAIVICLAHQVTLLILNKVFVVVVRDHQATPSAPVDTSISLGQQQSKPLAEHRAISYGFLPDGTKLKTLQTRFGLAGDKQMIKQPE